MSNFDAIVLGVGAMGAAACRALARRGVRTLGLDRFEIPHGFGSHHGGSRMFRTSYFEHPDYVPLLRRSFDLWKELAAAEGLDLFRVTGGLYIGRPDGPTVGAAAEAALRHGVPHELLGRTELVRRFPQFRVPDDFAALYEPNAGFIRPELAISAMVTDARRFGADIRPLQQVTGWSADANSVSVTAGTQVIRADRLVVTAGAWTSGLMPALPPLIVSRQVTGWVSPPRPDDFAEPRFPCWAVESPDGPLYYGFPLESEATGLKFARHARGDETTPESIDRTPTPEDEASFRPALRRFLPDADGPLRAMSVCMYTNSPDAHFIIDRHPRHERVALACGFSGHGFKFAPVVGEALADLVIDGRSNLPIGFLGLGRFAARGLS